MKHLIHASVITALLGFSGFAQAAVPLTVIASDKTDITVAGQDYDSTTSATFYRSGLPLSSISNVSLNLLVEGDYDYVDADESLTFNIENLYEFVLARNATNSTYLGSSINYYRLEGNLNIEQSTWNAIAASVAVDNEINITWQNSGEVEDMETLTRGAVGGDFVSYSIKGVSAVPEPSTYALMLAGLGLVGFMASRRRKVLI